MYWFKTAPVDEPWIRGEEHLRGDDKGTNIAQAEQNKQKENNKVSYLPGKKQHITTQIDRQKWRPSFWKKPFIRFD